MHRSTRLGAHVALSLILTLAVAVPASGVSNTDAVPRSGANTARAVVLLASPPTTAAVRTVDGAAAGAHRAQLAEERTAFKEWLAGAAPQATVVAEYDTVLNGLSVQLNGFSAAGLAAAPGVKEVLQPIWMAPSMDTSLELINWSSATGSNPSKPGSSVGQDVLVAIIDTGIDQNHPFFSVNARNKSFYEKKGQGAGCKYDYSDGDGPNFEDFTTCKVVVAKVFNADKTYTPQDFYGHGTHVAGTVGGNSGTDSNSGVMSGVAPAAVLGNYNVFPGTSGSASSDDIADAVDEAVADGMDVLNLSLGGDPLLVYDVLDLALKNAADVGVVSAVAAGNSGPGSETIQSPGWTPWVLTAGASTNPHFLGQAVSHADAGTGGAAIGDFNPFPDPAISAEFVWWDTIDGAGNGEACETVTSTGADLTGKVALIKRGTCTFTTKIRNAENLGAIGVVIFNQVAGDPVAMGHDGTTFPEIPAVMVGNAYGTTLTAYSGTSVTAGGPISEQDGIPDIIAGFSSRGPADTPDGLTIKPDMAAPGVNVNSSVPCDESGCGFAFYQGTSMATPHLAGAVAALIWDRGWQAAFPERDEQTKSLLVNNALDGVITDHRTGTELVGVNDEGSGRLEMVGAFAGTFYADPVSFSFGELPPGMLTATATVTFSGDTGTIGVSGVTDPGVAGVTITSSVVGNEVTLALTRTAGVVLTDVEGTVTVSNGTQTIHLAYFGRLD